MSPAPARETLFDPTGLLEFADADEVRELTEMFSAQMTAGLPALRAAIAARDSTTIHQIAHRLKGSAATIGAISMSREIKPCCLNSSRVLAKDGVACIVAGSAWLHACI